MGKVTVGKVKAGKMTAGKLAAGEAKEVVNHNLVKPSNSGC